MTVPGTAGVGRVQPTPLASPDHAVFERWMAEQGQMCRCERLS
ncbi:MAG: hypothetical protein ACRDUV_22185 [Pseudonocardiaceae bacterium]